MKKLILFGLLIAAIGCSGDVKTTPNPPTPNPGLSVIYWDKLAVAQYADGSSSDVLGYKVICKSSTTSDQKTVDVGNVSEYKLADIGMTDGNWTCQVNAYDNIGVVLSNEFVNIKVENEHFTKP